MRAPIVVASNVTQVKAPPVVVGSNVAHNKPPPIVVTGGPSETTQRGAISFGSAEQRSKPLDGTRLINLFPEQPPLGSRAPGLVLGQNTPIKAVLYGTPGIKSWVSTGIGPIRAGRLALGYVWALSGQRLYRIASDGTKTLCGGDTIEPSGNAMMTDNGRQLAVLVNGKTYVVGARNARAAFRITGGTYEGGTNEITDITVNGVSILTSDVNWSQSNEATAAAIVAEINSSTADYEASSNGNTVTIEATMAGVGANGYAVAITVAGDFTVNKTATVMGGGSAGSTTVREVTDSDYPTEGASSIDFIDGYTVWTKADSSQFFISDLYNTTVLDALDFATAESNPSNLVRVLAHHGELWLFKERGGEVWANTGAAPFPFERIRGATFDKGCASTMSATIVDGVPFWLGDDGIVYRAQGYQPTRISEHWLEDEIRGQTISDAIGMTYVQGGHTFYVLTCPTLDRTYCYDVATGRWHLRQSGTSTEPAQWQVRCLFSAFGKVLAGHDNGRVGEVDMDTYAEFGEEMRAAARTPPIFADGRRVIATEIELECELGVGLSSGQGSDPVVMVRWSDDGGATWSNERQASLGMIGSRIKRAVVRRGGQFRQRMYEFAVSDPVKKAFYGYRAEIIA